MNKEDQQTMLPEQSTLRDCPGIFIKPPLLRAEVAFCLPLIILPNLSEPELICCIF